MFRTFLSIIPLLPVYPGAPISQRRSSTKQQQQHAEKWVPRFTGETLEIPERPSKYRKDQRIYSLTILCTRDQKNLRFTRVFTAAIKAQGSLRLPYIGSEIQLQELTFYESFYRCNKGSWEFALAIYWVRDPSH